MKTCHLPVLAFGLVGMVANGIRAGDWPQMQRDAGKTGANPMERIQYLAPKYNLGLKAVGTDTVFNLATAVVVGDTVFVGTTDGSAMAVSSRSGIEKWRVQTAGPVRGAPAYVNGLVIFPSNDGALRALNSKEGGEETWRFDAGSPITGPPMFATISNEVRLFFGTSTGKIFCVRANDGMLMWTASTSGAIWGSPSLNLLRGHVYVPSYDGNIYALDAATGSRIWVTGQMGIGLGPVRGTVAVLGDSLYVPTLRNGLVALHDAGSTVTQKWQFWTGTHTGSAAVVQTGPVTSPVSIFVANDAGWVWAIEDSVGVGSKVWEKNITSGNRIAASLAYSYGQLFVCSEEGKLHVVDAVTGNEKVALSATAALDSSPAIAHGDIIVADASGRLYNFGNPLDPPRNLSAMVDDNQRIVLSWSPEYAKPLGVTPVSGYTIYRSLQPDREFAPIGYVEGQQIIRDERGIIIATFTTSVYTDSSITSSGFYYYSITAMNEETGVHPLEESTYSETAVAEVNFQPVPPRVTELTATAGDGVIRLNWEAKSGNSRISRLWLFRSEGSGALLALSHTLTAEETSFEDIRVENGIGYSYALMAVNIDGVAGPKSAEVTATPYTIGWPMFQRNAIHEGSDESVDIAPPLGVHWSVTLTRQSWRQGPFGPQMFPYPGGPGYSEWQTPAVVAGTVFITSLGGDVRAYRESTGDLIWAKSGYWGTWSTPAYHNGRLYVFYEFGLIVFNASNGDVAWEMGVEEFGFDPLPQFMVPADSPIIYKGVLLVSVVNRLIAIDIESHTVLWSSGSTVSIAASRGRIFTAVRNGNIQCVDPQTGDIIWEHAWGNNFASTLNPQMINISVFPYAVLVTHLDGNIYALNYDNGEIMWWSDVLDGFSYISPAEQGSTCFVANSYMNGVHAIKVSDGAHLWSTVTFTMTENGSPVYDESGHVRTTDITHGGPVVAGNRLYVYSTTGELLTIDIGTGDILDNYGIGAEVLRFSEEAGLQYKGYNGFPDSPNIMLAGHMSVGQDHLFVTAPDGRLMVIGPVLAGPPSIIVQPGIGQLELSWNQPVVAISPIAGYRIFRSTSYAEAGSAVAEVAGVDITAYTDIDITTGITYYYRVAAVDEKGIQGRTSGYAYGTAWSQPNIIAQISTPVTGSTGCLNPVFTITVTGTASSGNFERFTLQANTGSGLEMVNTSSTPVVNGRLGVVTFSQGGSATLLLTVFDAAGVQGSATAIVDVSAKNLTAEVTWPSGQVIIPYSCDSQPMTVTLTGVAFGDRFTGYRLEVARLSSSLTVLSASVYSDPVYTNGRLGMVTLPDCDSFVIRLIVSDGCGRERTVAVTLELQSPVSFLASITTFSARGRLPGEHRRPMDVAVDKEDFVWVVDTMNKRVQKYTATGRFLFEFGEQDAGLSDGIIFREPVAAAFDSANRLLVLDRLSGLVMRFDDSGRAMGVFGGIGSGPGVFNHPLGLGVDGWDRIWVADTLNNRIQVFDSQGRLESMSGVRGDGIGEFQHPSGVQPHTGPMPGGMIIVADTGNDRVQLIGESRSFLMGFGGPGTAPGEFNGPYEAIIGSDNSIFTSDIGNNRIEWRVPDGHTLILLPPASVTLFNMPHGLTLDQESSMLYVADTGNNRIVAIRIRHAADTIPPRALITGPAGGSVVSGDVDVIGIAADAYFLRYRLEYGAGSAPEDYTLITESTEPIWNGVLGKWDTGTLQPGSYRLRLTVEDRAGNKTMAEATVEVREPAPLIVTAKAEPPAFDPDITGTVLSYQTSVPAGVRIVIMRHGSGRRVWAAEIEESDGNGWTPEVRTVTWDGKDENGQLVEPGKYTAVLVARTGEKTETRQLSLMALSSPAALARSLGGASANGNPVAGASQTNTASAGGAMVGSGGEASPGAGSNPETGSELNRSTHDNGMDKGRNPKDFDRGSNPGHGNK